MADHFSVFILKYAKKEKVFYCLDSSLRSWRYCVCARLKFWRRSRVPKKGSREEAVGISRGFAARDGSAVKCHSTILQRLRRQISLDYYTIPPATQAIRRPILDSFKEVMTSYKESNKHDLN